MGYYNPLLKYGEQEIVHDCREAGVNGFIVVDLPPEECLKFRAICRTEGLSYIPLLTPTTTDDRMKMLASVADSFLYVVSVTGVTGARATVSSNLPDLTGRIRQFTTLPLAVGFGVSTREQFMHVGSMAEGVVIGSAIIAALEKAEPGKAAEVAETYARTVTGKNDSGTGKESPVRKLVTSLAPSSLSAPTNGASEGLLDARFGDFGGRYVPETLVDALDELEKAYVQAKSDPKFWEEFRSHYDFVGRPSKLQLADRITEKCGGARVWLKREDLNHTGAHKINNAMGQALLAKRLGKKRIIAETGAGQHGVATATICAKFGLECIVYMGSEDVRRQALNVFRMHVLGAKVVPVDSGSRTLKDAINEAMRDWVSNVTTTHYLVGSAIGPHPFPTIVRDFQSVIGQETREQMLARMGKLPDVVVACVGGGSNAIGMFHPFISDRSVRLVGVEAGGDGVNSGKHSATLAAGVPGVLHGTRTYLMQDEHGQISETHSISAGLDYPGVGPEHAWLKDSNRAEYVAVTDREALAGFRSLCELEGIIPALESAHAVYQAMQIAPKLGKDQDLVICLSGRGDKDLQSVAENLPKFD